MSVAASRSGERLGLGTRRLAGFTDVGLRLRSRLSARQKEVDEYADEPSLDVARIATHRRPVAERRAIDHNGELVALTLTVELDDDHNALAAEMIERRPWRSDRTERPVDGR